jgi:hypothetical protein
MPETVARCPAAPAGESHRWKLPLQGVNEPARCRHCGAERVFAPFDETSWWDTSAERAHDRPLGFSLHGRGGERMA